MARKRKVAKGLRRKVTPGEVFERVNAMLPAALVQSLRIHCVQERISLSVAVEEALRRYLKS